MYHNFRSEWKTISVIYYQTKALVYTFSAGCKQASNFKRSVHCDVRKACTLIIGTVMCDMEIAKAIMHNLFI